MQGVERDEMGVCEASVAQYEACESKFFGSYFGGLRNQCIFKLCQFVSFCTFDFSAGKRKNKKNHSGNRKEL